MQHMFELFFKKIHNVIEGNKNLKKLLHVQTISYAKYVTRNYI